MTTRYYEETSCEHGNYPRQCGVPYGTATGNTPLLKCPGGQRRELTSVEASKLLIDPGRHSVTSDSTEEE